MIVFKQVRTKKTSTGYSISVFMQDGNHVKPLISCIERYFAWVAEQEDPHRQERIIKEVEDEAERLKEGKIIS